MNYKKILEVVVNDMRWADSVAQLLGPEWDWDGNKCKNYLYDILYDRYGDNLTRMMDDHFHYSCKNPTMTIDWLYNKLEEYKNNEK